MPLESGAPTINTLKELDEKFQEYAPHIATVDAKDLVKLQADYVDLEGTAVAEKYLGLAKALVAGAQKNGAETYAPNSFRQAELDLKAAELAVSANRNNPSSYADAVKKAQASASFLNATLEATKQGKVDENTAAKLVTQDSKIKALGAEVASADKSISAQQAIDESRRQLSPEEADVFQQGTRLVFRLKNIKFPSGKSDLPADSLPLLAKVSRIAEKLGPQSVIVEGHTDSVGGTELNEQLSQERAETVSKYLSSNGISAAIITIKGYGFSKPIASNKSALGRAENRRVDIIVTPGANGRRSDAVEGCVKKISGYLSACRGVATEGGEDWWTRRGSNARPSQCHCDALPAELRAPIRNQRGLSNAMGRGNRLVK